MSYTDRDRLAAYEYLNDLTSTPYMCKWDGDVLTMITMPGVTVADIQAVTDGQVDAYRAGIGYPDPVVIVPGLTTNGTPDGKTYRLAVVDGELIVATNSASPQRPWSTQSAEFVRRALAAKASRAAVTYAARTMIRAEDLTTNEVQELVSMLPAWATVTAYAIGDVVSYDGKVWECVQAHTSQADWTPSTIPALWKARSPSDSVIMPWVQPTGAHDAYAVDAIVTYGGKTWRNTSPANVYAPGVYGWVEVL